MMQQRGRLWAMIGLLVFAVGLSAGGQPGTVAEQPPLSPVMASAQLRLRAEAGDFGHLLSLLKGEDVEADLGQWAPGLISELERYQLHASGWRESRRGAFAFSHGEALALADGGQIEDALAFAIDAHGVADDKAAFLEDEGVRHLVAEALSRAEAAVAEARWIEAMDLYRRLDLLFDDQDSIYRRGFMDTARHLRVLRVYVPEQLKAMYEQRARDRNEDLDPVQFGEDTWNERLKGINRPILMQTLNEAERRHVNSAGYKPLLVGAVNAALTLLATPGLETQFPELADAKAVDTFRQTLHTQKARLERVKGDLTRFEAADVFERIFSANQRSVRLPENVLVYELSEGALATLDDFTSVIWPYDYEQFVRNTRGTFPGVGIQISMSEAPLTVVDLDDAAPAAALGLREGDRLTWIDGQDISGYSPRYVMWKLRQAAATPRLVRVERKGEPDPVTLTQHEPVDVKVKRPAGRLTVKSPLRGTPAFDAGVQADDVVIAVDGQSTTDWTLDQAVRRITGPQGTPVTLTLERKGEAEPLHLKIKRAEIDIESIKGWSLRPDGSWDFYIDKAQRIGYVRLSQFIPQTASDLDEAISQLQTEGGVDALVLDLRFDPGGLLNQAVEVVDRFIRSGIIVSTVNASGQVSDERRARPERTYKAFPLVVLVNQGSASASEIVAGALQDHGRAIIVGTRSFGKGSVQDLFRLGADHAYLKLTTQYYRLPNNRIIHRTPTAREWGIEPDLLVDMTDDQVRSALTLRQQLDVIRVNAEGDADASAILTGGFDPQLETALLVLKAQLLAQQLELAHNPQASSTP